MSSFVTLEQRAKDLIALYKSTKSDPDFTPKSWQDRAIKLIKEHEITKKATDCVSLINTFKALAADDLLLGEDLDTAKSIMVKRCIKHPAEERIGYALDLLLDDISKDYAKTLLFTIITKRYKEGFYRKIKSAIDKTANNEDCLSVKIRIAFLIVKGKPKATPAENSLTRFLSNPSKKQKSKSSEESITPIKSQPALNASFDSCLAALSKFKPHILEVVKFISNKADIPIINDLKAWLINSPLQKNRVILEICCILHKHEHLDDSCMSLFAGALKGSYLDYEKHWQIHDAFNEACTKFNKFELYQQFEAHKNRSHAIEGSDRESSCDEDEKAPASESLQGTLENSKIHIEGLLQRALDSDINAFNALKQLYAEHIASRKKTTLPVAPEICLALAKAIVKKPDLFEYKVSPDDLRTQAKDIFEIYLKSTVEREGLLVDIAHLIYSGEILGKNLFLARHLLESCKDTVGGKFKLTNAGKILLAKMCFNREGGLEELDKAIDLLGSINNNELYLNPEALYMLGECYFVKKRLGSLQTSPAGVWKHAASLGHPTAAIAIQILTKYEFSFIQKNLDKIIGVSDKDTMTIEVGSDNPDSDYEADETYRGADSTTTADRDLTIDIIKRIRGKTSEKLSDITANNEEELTKIKQKSAKKGMPKKKAKQETKADSLEKIILEDYADIVNDYKPKVRSAENQINKASRPDYEALVHHAAKGELFAHLRKTDISYQLGQLRGMHCFNHLWSEAKVIEFKKQVLAAHHPLKSFPVYSAAVKEIAGVDSYYPNEGDKEAHLRLEQAARLLRYQMCNMKRAKGEYSSRPEVTQTVPRKFDDRLLQAQQFYTAYYTKFRQNYLPAVVEEPLSTTLKTAQVPFVSTADIQSIHAVRYAVGDKV
jgi:hypothetical protein